MIDKVTQLRNRIAQLDSALSSGKIIEQIIYDNEAYIIDMNAEIQLYENGENSLGVSIADYAPYSPYTIQVKEAKGQPTNRVTLRDEGDFEESFYLEVNNIQFEIKASDFKTEDLIKKYGRNILGLTDKNIQELIWDYIYPDIIKKTKEIIYGN